MSLLKKYNVPAPRYASYPSVPYWNSTPTKQQWLEHLSRALNASYAAQRGAAIYLHIPFCESLCTFCGCNTRITTNHQVATQYIEKLHHEWALYRRELKTTHNYTLSSFHLGGGTPTFLNADELDAVIRPILEDFTITSEHEFSVEVDPRVTTREHLKVLAELGFNRLSLGVQDLDTKVQTIVNRVQPLESVRDITEQARDEGFTSINYDLIYGLPLQTEASIRNTIAQVIKLNPDSIAYYAYVHVPWIKPVHRRFVEGDVPDAQLKRKLYAVGRELFEAYGYQEIGLDHFAKRSDKLWQAMESQNLHRNVSGYSSQNGQPLLGLGVSAISDAGSALLQNEKVLEKYYAALERDELPILRGHVLDEEDLVLKQHILNLMTRHQTDWTVEHHFTEHLLDVPARLKEFEKDGLVEISAREVRILPKGRPFLRNVAMAFDARLSRKVPHLKLFNKSN